MQVGDMTDGFRLLQPEYLKKKSGKERHASESLTPLREKKTKALVCFLKRG